MGKFNRPQSLQDIQPSGSNVYRSRSARLNLSYRRTFRFQLTPAIKAGVALTAVWLLILGSVAAPTAPIQSANAANTQEERAALEAQLKELEKQIDDYETQVSSYQRQGTTLKNEVARLNSQIAKLNLQIKAINLTLNDLDYKISDTQQKITSTEASIAAKRQSLAELLQTLYENDRSSMVEIFLKNSSLTDFFADINDLTLLQQNLESTISQIASLRDELQEQNDQFSLARADAETIRVYQLRQKNQTDSLKSEKNQLIAVTKGEESKYQALLKETQKTAAEIRGRIFQLLGGGEMTFAQAYEFAKNAAALTGVRAALILAVLDRESALGQNVGRCTYNQINSTTGQPTMHPRRDVPAFLEITAELGLDPETVMVSCAIPRDGAYGGAMGPGQFIPSTWQIYKKEVGQLTGQTPASPWNNSSAFVATALYLRDAGAANASLAEERKAAARYYAGGNWQRFLWTYGEATIARANRFEEDIRTIGG